jgi:hypothetical protein
MRRRRAIAEFRRQIDFEMMWADPCRWAAYDRLRRIFYQHRPDLYEPVPKTIGRRALLVSLGTLLATPVLAEAPDTQRSNASHRGAGLAGVSGSRAADDVGSRVDVRNFGTATHPYRGGSDDAVPSKRRSPMRRQSAVRRYISARGRSRLPAHKGSTFRRYRGLRLGSFSKVTVPEEP